MTVEPPSVGVIIVAAGSGQRLGRGMPKALVRCAGRTLIEYALDGALASGVARHICVVVPQGDTEISSIIDGMPHEGITVTTVDGGASRPESVRAGLAQLPADVDVILVHDAARALTPPSVFQNVVAAVAQGAPAVVPGIPVPDTVKVVQGTTVTATPPRASLRAIQTPQGFDAATLRNAHSLPDQAGNATDDAMLVEQLGVAVKVIEGDRMAFKVTAPHDLLLAESIVAHAQEAAK